MALREEIRQQAPFETLEQETFLNLLRTTSQLTDAVELLLRPYGLSVTQFNVLRILRGSGSALCRNELRDRMLSRGPDMTRLLDRMESAGLVERCRGLTDRRLVSTTITPAGLELLAVVNPLVAAEHQRTLGHMNETQLSSLIDLLEIARNPEA